MDWNNQTLSAERPARIDTCFQISTATAFTTNGDPTPYIVNATLNSVLSVVTTTANALVLWSLRLRTTSLHLPSKLLFYSLVLTDLAVGALAQPLLVMFLTTKAIGESANAHLCLMITSTTLIGAFMACVSLMNMAAISMDRYIAVHHHLKYHEVVTPRRVCATLVFIWACAAGFVSCWLVNKVIYISYGVVILSMSSLTTVTAYAKIYRELRTQNARPAQEPRQIDVAQYRRSASSMLWVYGLTTLCYMPYVCVEISRRFFGDPVLMECLLEFSVTVVYLNSCLNPFLYCLRLSEIRAGVLQILGRAKCHWTGRLPRQDDSSWMRETNGTIFWSPPSVS